MDSFLPLVGAGCSVVLTVPQAGLVVREGELVVETKDRVVVLGAGAVVVNLVVCLNPKFVGESVGAVGATSLVGPVSIGLIGLLTFPFDARLCVTACHSPLSSKDSTCSISVISGIETPSDVVAGTVLSVVDRVGGDVVTACLLELALV